MPRLQLVFVDYDGTLLTDARVVSPTTRRALREAADAGLCLVPASGRPLDGLSVPGLEDPEAAIGLNGAVVQRRGGVLAIEAESLDPDDVESCLALARRKRASANLYTAKSWFAVDPGCHWVRREMCRVGLSATRLDTAHIPFGIHKALLLGSVSILDKCEDDLATRGMGERLRWFRSEDEYLEIGHRSVTKATGARAVRDWLGPVRTYAIGDGVMDVAMFQVVDVGIAVGNASRFVQRHADAVVGSNVMDGVAEALSKILAGEI
jgi:Cof subfamily protein (haloacid dehalogenase superfamily)